MTGRPPQTLIRNAGHIVTMDARRRELRDTDILLRGGAIAAIGANLALPDGAELIDAGGCVVTPGLVNTHHHLYQSLTRAVPGAQDALLFGWLERLYPIWARMTPEDVVTATSVGLAELALSGCSMTSDHLYIFPNGTKLDDTIRAAAEIGMRFHPTRGAMSLGRSKGGLPPDELVEEEEAILADCQRVISAFHDPSPGAMCRVGIAPCSPFSVTTGLMRDAAELARDCGVMLHTHLAENDEDVAYSLDRFGCRPGDYARDLGWTGPDVWHAHCVRLDKREIDLFARTGTGVAHCPCSNCRLGSGVAPVRRMRDRGVRVGLGVDGSASNDAGHLLAEARQAMLLQRVTLGADAMSAREALEIATLGGAQVLGRGDDCGSIEIGKRADIAIWDLEHVREDNAAMAAAGAWDPVAALVLTGPHGVRDLLVDGRLIVRQGRLTTLDAHRLARRARTSIARMADGD